MSRSSSSAQRLVQLDALPHDLALLERIDHRHHAHAQRGFERLAGDVAGGDEVAGVAAHRLAEGGRIEAFLVAEVVADGRDVDLGLAGDLARGSLGEALLREQPQGSVEQPVACLGAVCARCPARCLGDRISRVHDRHYTTHEIKRLINLRLPEGLCRHVLTEANP